MMWRGSPVRQGSHRTGGRNDWERRFVDDLYGRDQHGVGGHGQFLGGPKRWPGPPRPTAKPTVDGADHPSVVPTSCPKPRRRRGRADSAGWPRTPAGSGAPEHSPARRPSCGSRWIRMVFVNEFSSGLQLPIVARSRDGERLSQARPLDLDLGSHLHDAASGQVEKVSGTSGVTHQINEDPVLPDRKAKSPGSDQ